ncbi:hypothetical protein HAX54_007531 [Datura stramonium]|uniref:Uncharacterized protein n=1 Tax=Datura stramonium TaxID=4076 RepID=A0ABS8TEL2_DATST|nr:hypothetical protein [Datura stramonium]
MLEIPYLPFSHQETLLIDWCNHKPRTIKVINFDGPLSGNPLVKYLFKNATEKFIIATKFEGSDASQDYVKMAQEFQSFPRFSLHTTVVFSYGKDMAEYVRHLRKEAKQHDQKNICLL